MDTAKSIELRPSNEAFSFHNSRHPLGMLAAYPLWLMLWACAGFAVWGMAARRRPILRKKRKGAHAIAPAT
jgi:hypothetical protein